MSAFFNSLRTFSAERDNRHAALFAAVGILTVSVLNVVMYLD